MADIAKIITSLTDDERDQLVATLMARNVALMQKGDGVAPAVKELKRKLDVAGIRYLERAKGVLIIPFGGEEGEEVIVTLFVYGRSGMRILTADLVGFDADKLPRAQALVSELNSEYRFAKFCIDDDNTIHAEADVPSCDEAGMRVLLELVTVIVDVCRDALPKLREL